MLLIVGSLSNSTWHVPETKASHANLSRAVDCFTGDIHHSRETGPPEQPQREVRWPQTQSRPFAAHKNNYKAVANPVLNPSLPRKPHEHRRGHDFAQKLDRCIPVAAACVGLRGCASHPRRPNSDSLFGHAGRNNWPLTAAPRGGYRRLLVARPVGCPRVFVNPCALLVFFNTLFFDMHRTQRHIFIFFRKFI